MRSQIFFHASSRAEPRATEAGCTKQLGQMCSIVSFATSTFFAQCTPQATKICGNMWTRICMNLPKECLSNWNWNSTNYPKFLERALRSFRRQVCYFICVITAPFLTDRRLSQWVHCYNLQHANVRGPRQQRQPILRPTIVLLDCGRVCVCVNPCSEGCLHAGGWSVLQMSPANEDASVAQ